MLRGVGRHNFKFSVGAYITAADCRSLGGALGVFASWSPGRYPELGNLHRGSAGRLLLVLDLGFNALSASERTTNAGHRDNHDGSRRVERNCVWSNPGR